MRRGRPVASVRVMDRSIVLARCQAGGYRNLVSRRYTPAVSQTTTTIASKEGAHVDRAIEPQCRAGGRRRVSRGRRGLGALGNRPRAVDHRRGRGRARRARLDRRPLHPGVTPPELVLTYERDCWRATGLGLDVAHADLHGVEQRLIELLAERGA